jgi:hypothetical protein
MIALTMTVNKPAVTEIHVLRERLRLRSGEALAKALSPSSQACPNPR